MGRKYKNESNRVLKEWLKQEQISVCELAGHIPCCTSNLYVWMKAKLEGERLELVLKALGEILEQRKRDRMLEEIFT